MIRMATIHNFSIGSNQTRVFLISNGSVSESNAAALTYCGTVASDLVAINAVGQSVAIGEARKRAQNCDEAPGGVVLSVIGSRIASQPQPVSYSVSSGSSLLVVGSINKSESPDGDQAAPTDPNFGGEPPVVDPAPPPASPSPPSLPSGNGNFGFGTVSSAGSQLGITGGNT